MLFKVVCVIILVLQGIRQPAFFFFAVPVALSIPLSFRSAKVNFKLRKEPPKNQEHLLHFIFKHLKQLGYGNLPSSTRHAMVKDVRQRYYQSSGKWTTRVFLIILYFSSLLSGMAGSLQAVTPNWISAISSQFESPQQTRDRFTKNRQRQVERLTETLRLNPNDVDAYIAIRFS